MNSPLTLHVRLGNYRGIRKILYHSLGAEYLQLLIGNIHDSSTPLQSPVETHYVLVIFDEFCEYLKLLIMQ